MKDWHFPYPPPWQDIATLELHVCAHRDTIRKWMRLYDFPQPVVRGTTERWQWSKVDAWMALNPAILEEVSVAEGVRDATRKAVNAG